MNGIHFGVRFGKLPMIALTDNLPVMHNNRSHHGIRSGETFPFLSELQAAVHKFFVCRHFTYLCLTKRTNDARCKKIPEKRTESSLFPGGGQ
jgi:hypothetical protein